jgi:hypothetical protein
MPPSTAGKMPARAPQVSVERADANLRHHQRRDADVQPALEERARTLVAPMIAMNPKQQLDRFLKKYDPEIASIARRALAKMRKRLPGAVEIVYDNYNALAIGFGPSEKASLAIFSIVLYPRWVNLFFLQGVKLPDPARRLRGSGNVVRSVRLDDDTLDDPEIQKLVEVALARAKMPIDRSQRRKLVIRSVSAKQRARRPRA